MFLGKSYFPQCKLKVLLLCCHQYAQCDHKFFYLAAFHFIIIGTFLSYSTFANGEVREAIFFRKPTRPSLPLRKAPHLSPRLSLLRRERMCQPPYSVLKPLRYKVGGPSEVYASSGAAVFLCGNEPALRKSSLWERRDTNGCLWERRDIRIDACRGERLAECSQKPFGLHLSPNSTPYIRPIYFWRFFLLVVN